MARRRTEPVRHTCPDIDRLIATITRIVKEMDNCDDRDSQDDLLENIKSWSSDLTSIGYGKYCELETLRDSNAALRDWGQEMYNEAESLEAEKDQLEKDYTILESKMEELQEEIEELKADLQAP